jgi:hypothetical protein
MTIVMGTIHVREPRRGSLQTLDGAEHRDGGRDDAIAVEERGPEEDDEHERVRTRLDRNETQQGEDAALAVVARAHDEGQVLHRHDEHERPEDEREHAEHVLRARGDAVLAAERLGEREERVGPEVAVDDA